MSGLLLLIGDGLARTLARARIGARALSTDRQATTVADATVAANVLESLDRDAKQGAQVAFDREVAFHEGADLADLLIAELADFFAPLDPSLVQDERRPCVSDPKDVGQTELGTFGVRNVDA